MCGWNVCVCVCQVSQVMLGLMVMSYSIPLHFTELTDVVALGVPWWSGLMVSLCFFFFSVYTVYMHFYSLGLLKN